jgi:hypothetical protein
VETVEAFDADVRVANFKVLQFSNFHAPSKHLIASGIRAAMLRLRWV